MTAVGYLLGLLLLSYLGTFLVGGRAARGFGLSSGVEYVVLGFLLGPVLGLVDRSTVALFDPLTHLAVGWLALLVGLDCGYVHGARVRARSVGASLAGALVTGGLIALVVGLLLPWLAPELGPTERWTLAVSVGVACTETTPHAIQWVLGERRPPGPIAQLLSEVADVDAIAPVLATAVLFALTPSGLHGAASNPAIGVGLGLGLGLATGLLTAALLGREFRLDESWKTLLGTALLTIGLAVQARTSPLAPMFLMGVTLSLSSRHRLEITGMLAPTERAVLLPAMLVAGARLDLTSHRAVGLIALAAIAARLLGRLLGGLGLASLLGPGSGARPWLGLGMASTGGLAMSIGLAFDLRYPGIAGDAVLVSAAAVTLVGEFVGPPTLRAALTRASELAGGTPLPADGTPLPDRGTPLPTLTPLPGTAPLPLPPLTPAPTSSAPDTPLPPTLGEAQGAASADEVKP